MPVIVPCGYSEDEVFLMRTNMRYLFGDTPINPDDLTFVEKEIPSKKVGTGMGDPFLLVFASNGWMAKHGQELLGVLTKEHEVCVVPLTVYAKGWSGTQL